MVASNDSAGARPLVLVGSAETLSDLIYFDEGRAFVVANGKPLPHLRLASLAEIAPTFASMPAKLWRSRPTVIIESYRLDQVVDERLRAVIVQSLRSAGARLARIADAAPDHSRLAPRPGHSRGRPVPVLAWCVHPEAWRIACREQVAVVADGGPDALRGALLTLHEVVTTELEAALVEQAVDRLRRYFFSPDSPGRQAFGNYTDRAAMLWGVVERVLAEHVTEGEPRFLALTARAWALLPSDFLLFDEPEVREFVEMAVLRGVPPRRP